MSEIVPIPLSSLMLSQLNVRRTERDAEVASLAEDIAVAGLEQNLVVVPAHFTTGEAEADWKDRFEVIAGGRRFQALQLLAAAGRLPADHPVPCRIKARDEARETSLSENLHRVAMNPADEFEAFAAIAAQWMQNHAAPGAGTSPEAVQYVAKRFGATTRHVEGRLRLAALCPEVLEALRLGKLSLESAKAYCGTTDHKHQLKVFKTMEKNSWQRHDPRAVRDALRGVTLPLGDGRVIWIGLDAYRAAGGRTETEMFMGSDGEERIADVPLLDKLCAEKAEPLLAALAKADGYKQGLFAPGCGHRYKLPKKPAGFVPRGYEYGDVAAKVRKGRIAIYTVMTDGTGLWCCDTLKPESEVKKPSQPDYQAESAEERAARLREERIDLWSARLAVGPFVGTPLEGRAFWPTSGWINKVEDQFEGEGKDRKPAGALVTIQIAVSEAAIEAARTAAEATVAELEAEEAARKAAQAEADEGDDEDGEFSGDDLEEEGAQ